LAISASVSPAARRRIASPRRAGSPTASASDRT
jgi:hypothetical protein